MDHDQNAETQNIFRQVNEHVAELNRQLGGSDAGLEPTIEVFCECGRAFCSERLRIDPEDYERVRADPTHFLLAPSHQTSLVERVVARGEGYVVVENEGRAAEIARDGDPRGDVRTQPGGEVGKHAGDEAR